MDVEEDPNVVDIEALAPGNRGPGRDGDVLESLDHEREVGHLRDGDLPPAGSPATNDGERVVLHDR